MRVFFLLSLSVVFNYSIGQNKTGEMIQALSKLNDTSYIKKCVEIAEAFTNDNNVKKALVYIDSAIIKASKLKDGKWTGYSYNALGNLYNYAGSYSLALDNFDKALKVYKEAHYVDGEINVYVNKGNSYYNTGEFKKAETIYKMAEDIYPQSRKYEVVLANIYNNLGGMNGALKKYVPARSYFLKALQLYKNNKDSISIAYAYNNLANIEQDQQHYTSALPLFQMALELKLRFGDNYEKAKAYSNLAENYYSLHDYQRSLNSVQKSLELTDTSIYNSHLINIYSQFAKVYEEMKMPDKANNYYKLLQRVNSRVAGKEIADQIKQRDMLTDLSKAHLTDSLVQESHIQLQNVQIKRNNTIKYFLIVVITLTFLFLFVLYRRFKESQFQKKEIELQKNIVDEKQKEIMDSLEYAKKIQDALLGEDIIKALAEQYFVFFKPKDIVSGDFFWTSHSNQKDLFYCAVCDSTGHGVPGAFMSILNSGFLNEAINEKQIPSPEKVFEYVRERLIQVIKDDRQKDGFDGMLICFDKAKKKVIYAAANNCPLLIRNKEIVALGFDKMPVGKGEKRDNFQLFSFDLEEGDIIYLFTDGFADQFGGAQGKKLKSRVLKEKLLEISALPLSEQKTEMETFFNNWKGNLDQIDDVTIIGLKF